MRVDRFKKLVRTYFVCVKESRMRNEERAMSNSSDAYVLYRIKSTINMKRFYRMSVQPNLFGGFSLVRTWGRIGNRGQVRIDLYNCETTALVARDRLLHRKQRRGYVPQNPH